MKRTPICCAAERAAQADVRESFARLRRKRAWKVKKRARQLIADAIQRWLLITPRNCAIRIPQPNEEMKGRIVVRNGRNILAFEAGGRSGRDVMTPRAVTVSCFDSCGVKLPARVRASDCDGRIHRRI
jgi:ribonuclease Y